MSPEALAAYEEDVVAWIELNRRRWLNTGNPLYVWRTIGLCFTFGSMRTHTNSGVLHSPPGPEPYPFPSWCVEYLGLVAIRVDALSEGRDFRTTPSPIGDAEPTRENWQAFSEKPPTLNATEAAELVAHATGTVRDGWNAFDRLAKLEAMEMDDFSEEALRFEGKSASEAMQVLLQESGINDERTMRRRLQRARQARAKPTP